MIEQHEWLARVVARQLKRSGEDFDDLMQVAMIGIFKAVERFDPAFGASFRMHASVTARGELRRHYRDAGWSVSVPRRLKDLRSDVAAATEVLREQLRRAPTTSEVAGYLRLSRDEVEECIAPAATSGLCRSICRQARSALVRTFAIARCHPSPSPSAR